MAPIAKVGGLGDVVTSLGRAVIEAGHRCEVILPKYDVLDYTQVSNLVEDGGFTFGGTFTKVFKGEVEGLPTIFLEPANGFFWCGCIYGADFKPVPMTDAERFGFFSKAALEFLRVSGRQPDIIHIHDWQTAPVARAYWEQYHKAGLPDTRIVFTIHNMNYGANLIAEAVAYSQRTTTVSRTYAEEIAGHPAIKPHLSKFRGVVNGIDPEIWDPLGDALLPAYYDRGSCASGKDAAKRALRQRLGLADRDVAVVGVVTRLTGQKGINQIKAGLYRALERGAQAVLLGSAPDPAVQKDFERLADDLRKKYPNDAALVFKFDEPLSHLIYAGSDMLLVPSVFEPCGLSQLIAMRYGTVPVVRRTGGLADTVFDVDTDRDRAAALGLEPNGFNFEGTDAPAIDYALNRALDMFGAHRSEFRGLQQTCMGQDWSWNRPAQEYVELYHAALRS
jgi:starch synthase